MRSFAPTIHQPLAPPGRAWSRPPIRHELDFLDAEEEDESWYALDRPGRAASIAVLICTVALCNVAVLVAMVAGEAAYYLSLHQPTWAPEPWIIIPATIGAMSLLGIAAWLVWRSPPTIKTSTALGWLSAELVLGFAWTPIFFGAHALGTSAMFLGAALFASFAGAIAFGRVSIGAGILSLPSLGWLAYLTALDGALWWLN
jgi:tryptophan-rich sensory protein